MITCVHPRFERYLPYFQYKESPEILGDFSTSDLFQINHFTPEFYYDHTCSPVIQLQSPNFLHNHTISSMIKVGMFWRIYYR